MFIGENEESPERVGGESPESVVDGQVPVFDLFENNGEQNDVVNGGILEQINLTQDDVGVENENRRRRREKARVFLLAEFAERCAAEDVIAEIVLSHHLIVLSVSFINPKTTSRKKENP